MRPESAILLLLLAGCPPEPPAEPRPKAEIPTGPSTGPSTGFTEMMLLADSEDLMGTLGSPSPAPGDCALDETYLLAASAVTGRLRAVAPEKGVDLDQSCARVQAAMEESDQTWGDEIIGFCALGLSEARGMTRLQASFIGPDKGSWIALSTHHCQPQTLPPTAIWYVVAWGMARYQSPTLLRFSDCTGSADLTVLGLDLDVQARPGVQDPEGTVSRWRAFLKDPMQAKPPPAADLVMKPRKVVFRQADLVGAWPGQVPRVKTQGGARVPSTCPWQFTNAVALVDPVDESGRQELKQVATWAAGVEPASVPDYRFGTGVDLEE